MHTPVEKLVPQLNINKMKHRLSLEERHELAFKLRSQILMVENPQRLEALSDPEFQPHNQVRGSYAFEYFMDRCRSTFRIDKVKANISYNIGWSKETLSRDEELKSPGKVVRMATTIFMVGLEQAGSTAMLSDSWHDHFCTKGVMLDKNQLAPLLYEILYELTTELAQELFHDLK